MQFRQVGKRIQVLAPMWDSEAKRTRQRLVYSFPADDPPIAHSVDIKALDGLDRDAAATEINKWNEARRKEIQDERSKNVTSIAAHSIKIYKSFDPIQTIDSEGWSMGVGLNPDDINIYLSKEKRIRDNEIAAFITFEHGKDNAKVMIRVGADNKSVKHNMKIVDAIEECNALIEAFEG